MSSSRAAKIDEERVDQILFYRRLILGMVAVLVTAVIGLTVAFSTRAIWVAPDLSTGQLISSNSPYRAYPYSFAYRYMDTVWNWVESGEKEYPMLIKAVERYSQNSLVNEFKQELALLSGRGVMKNRTRKIKEIIPRDPSKMVQPLNGEKFVVYLDLEVIDKIDGAVVSWKRMRYSFIVAVDTSDIDNNGYGLEMVSYYRSPRNLER